MSLVVIVAGLVKDSCSITIGFAMCRLDTIRNRKIRIPTDSTQRRNVE